MKGTYVPILQVIW